MKFALIGAAGYIAPRHMDAISRLGGDLIAAYDPHDSVGILDRYFPECHYFREFERFDRHLSRLGELDYLVVCSPNYLHDAHIRFGLRLGANVICEKPVVLNERNLDELLKIEQASKTRVSCILQMRLHMAFEQMAAQAKAGPRQILIDYQVPRGLWYQYSWKGDIAKSGGLATNIGTHAFDVMGCLFGAPEYAKPCFRTTKIEVGAIKFRTATVEYSLGVDNCVKPKRWIEFDQKLFDFSNGFAYLHQQSYENILNNASFGLEDARLGVRICESLR